MLTDVEHRIACLIRGVMRTDRASKQLNALADADRAFVAVIFQVREPWHLLVPARQKLHQQTNSRGRQNGVWPDDLRTGTSSPICLRFLRQPLISDDPTAPQARFSGRRKNNLAADEILVRSQLPNIHADIDIGDEVAPR